MPIIGRPIIGHCLIGASLEAINFRQFGGKFFSGNKNFRCISYCVTKTFGTVWGPVEGNATIYHFHSSSTCTACQHLLLRCPSHTQARTMGHSPTTSTLPTLNACGPFWSRLGPWHATPPPTKNERERTYLAAGPESDPEQSMASQSWSSVDRLVALAYSLACLDHTWHKYLSTTSHDSANDSKSRLQLYF